MALGRVITAMVTPMSENGAINYDNAQRLAAHLLQSGSDALVISGSTGESPTLSPLEKIDLFAAVKEVTAEAKKPLIAGTSGSDTASAVELSRRAENVGADAVLAVVPPYNKPSQEGLYQHFAAIANAVSLPVIVYNVPSRTAVNLEAETVRRLSEINNIVALKEAGGSLDQASRIRRMCPEEFLLYSGDDNLTLPMLAIGAAGVISIASHLIGPQLQQLISAYMDGHTVDAARLHLQYYDAFKKLFIRSNPVPLKYALWKIGLLDHHICRLPLTNMDLDGCRVIDQLLFDLHLL